jgi:mRNA-degrading endonuclease toxin of MazEF toxin-antitoxin module
MPIPVEVKRGDIYWVEIRKEETKGSEQYKRRPFIIVSRTAINRLLATVIAVPLSTVIDITKPGPPFRVVIPATEISRDISYHSELQTSVAKTDQARVIDKTRLENRMGSLSQTACAAVGLGLSYLLDL